MSLGLNYPELPDSRCEVEFAFFVHVDHAGTFQRTNVEGLVQPLTAERRDA